MNRIKFLVFAVVALGLACVQLWLVSPSLAAKAVEASAAAASNAPSTVALRIESERSALQTGVLKVANSPAAVWPVQKSINAERVNAVRAAAKEALPAPLLDGLWVGLRSDDGSMWVQGEGEPAPIPEQYDAKLWAGAGANGLVVDFNGTPQWVFSVPVVSVERGEAKAVASAFVGVPALGNPNSWLEATAKQAGMQGLGIAAQGKLLFAAGTQRPWLEKAAGTLKLDEPGVVGSGSIETLGPLALPMLLGDDGATLAVGVRKALKGTPYEVVAVVSTQPFMKALTDYQRLSLFMVVGLFAGALVIMMLLTGEATVVDRPMKVQSPVPVPVMPSRAAAAAEPLQMANVPPAPETHPDDFDLGSMPSQKHSIPAAASLPPEPVGAPAMVEAFESSMTESPAPVEAAPSHDPFDFMGKGPPPGMPQGKAPSVPLPAPRASSQPAPPSSLFDEPGYQPEATTVARVPNELLQATTQSDSNAIAALLAQSASDSPPPPRPSGPPTPAVKPMASSEEEHFQQTFREFVATREICGEPSDGLTYEKFVVKLRKNKEQLVAKYNCRSVRFQVHVKEGKAALKATPLKD